MGNCCSDEMGHAGAHPVGPAASAAASAAADRFLRSKGAGASTQIELSLSASNLVDQEYFPKCNPMVVVYSKGKDGQLEEMGRSEIILSSLNPSWSRKISVHYQFEVLQPLVFQLYNINPQFHDVSEKMLKLEEQEFLGEATCLLSEACGQTELRDYRSAAMEHGPWTCADLRAAAMEGRSSGTSSHSRAAPGPRFRVAQLLDYRSHGA